MPPPLLHDRHDGLRRLRALLPPTLHGRVRLLLLAGALSTALTVGPLLLVGSARDWTLRAGGGLALVLLCLWWIGGGRRHRFEPAWNLFAYPALLLATLGTGDFLATFSLVWIALMLPSMYWSLRRALVESLALSGLVLGVVALLPDSPGVASATVLTQLPGHPVTAVVLVLLARIVRKHDRVAARDRVLTEAGWRLAAAGDRRGVHTAALDAVSQLSAETPAAGVSVAAGGLELLEVVGEAGERPPRLDAASLSCELETRRPFELAPDGTGRTTFVAPLVVRGKLTGAIAVASDRPLPGETKEGLETVAIETALALGNAALFDDLSRNEARFRSLVQNSSDVIAIVERDSTLRYVTPSVERVFGHTAAALTGHRLTELLHPDDCTRVLALIGSGSDAALECRIAHLDRRWRQAEMTISSMLEEPSVDGIVLNVRDISERKALERRLQHEALHDPLTGLANRALFTNRVEHAVIRGERHEERLGVLFLDVDDLKTVNDTLGHAAGDALLCSVAERLRACARAGDTIARVGGDEFAILLPDTGAAKDAVEVAERVVAALGSPFRLEGREVFSGGSVGVALSASGEETAVELLRNADVAMYIAKARGKGRCVLFEPRMLAGLLERLELKADLQGALERGELCLFYQPLVTLGTGTIAGVEALVRWRHPQRGLVLPGEFIPLAQETGLILEIERWMLGEACRRGSAWQAHGEGDALTMSVNLSARHLREPGVAGEVDRHLKAGSLRPGLLSVEITEGALMRDADTTRPTLHELKGLGVRLAIDDFGSGYSSLFHLRRFPVDSIKIARPFVDLVGRGAAEAALVRAIVKLGESLELQTVAEGIERREQLNLLQEMGCDLGQGDYLARPLENAEMEEMLAGSRDGEGWLPGYGRRRPRTPVR